ncbi:hypothetical protein ACFV6E_04710 [Streptomyces sp. NPDC059785]|uniref:hypothetical protein n=1 Tax=Streptomyces sp. NPDC059785 TaxID=3346945 RepID=UPI00366043EC
MVSAAAHNIEVTTESLQADLARLKLQKQALERELAAVVAHLGSVQRTLSALEPLMRASAAAPVSAGAVEAVPAGTGTGTDTDADTGADADTDIDTDTDGQPRKKYGKLTEQILEYFAEAGDADVRARDVAAALGRDTDSGSINAVRSTLDRLVGTSRIRRAGRGLYRAERS